MTEYQFLPDFAYESISYSEPRISPWRVLLDLVRFTLVFLIDATFSVMVVLAEHLFKRDKA
jgi:hypothetical protein